MEIYTPHFMGLGEKHFYFRLLIIICATVAPQAVVQRLKMPEIVGRVAARSEMPYQV